MSRRRERLGRTSRQLWLLVLLAWWMLAAAVVAILVDRRLDPSRADLPALLSHGPADDVVLVWLLSVKAVVAALAAVVVVACWQVRRSLAVVAAGMVVVPNVVVQLVKHTPVAEHVLGHQILLSGHAALLSSVMLTWVALAPRRLTVPSAGCAVLALTGTLLGVGSVWHSVVQLIVPMLFSAAAVLVGARALPQRSSDRHLTRVAIIVAVACAVAAVAAVVVMGQVDISAVPPQDRVRILGPLPSLVVLLVVGAVTGAVAAGAVGRGLPRHGPACQTSATPGHRHGPE